MFFARSGLVAATLLVLQSTLSIAAPLSEKAVHELEKRITCQTTEVPINNACVSCASLYKNASTCTRSVPVTCSYGVVNSVRKCAAVDCTQSPGTYLSTDGKYFLLLKLQPAQAHIQCLECTDPAAKTCTSTMTLSCLTNYTLLPNNTCVYGTPYGQFNGYGLIKNFAPKQQPFRPYTPADGDAQNCARAYTKAKVIFFIGNSFDPATCTGQNGALDMNLVASNDPTAVVLVKGNCTELSQTSFVEANHAFCNQVFIGP